MEARFKERPLSSVEGVVLSAAGAIRARGGEEFRAHVEDMLQRSMPTALVIDLAKADSIDSTAVGYLLRIHDRLAAKGSAFALVAPSHQVRIVLDSIGLTEFFTVCDSLADAEDHILNA